MQLNIHDAQTQLSELVERVMKGERVVIAQGGKPCMDLVPHQQPGEPRKPGRLRGQIRMDEEFDQADDQIQTFFEGDS